MLCQIKLGNCYFRFHLLLFPLPMCNFAHAQSEYNREFIAEGDTKGVLYIICVNYLVIYKWHTVPVAGRFDVIDVM